MVKNLIKRPIAVTMCIIAILILGGVAISMLPVSLMPNVDIPQITIQISNPGANARDINDNLIQPIRNQLTQLSDIKEMRCEANNGGGIIFIEFEYGSNLDYNFIEVNEKIDRAYSSFPKELERPKVIKASATDIPAFFIDLTIKDGSKKSFMELSKFAKEVISKRIEQVEQVALVDVSGIQGTQILIEPYIEKIKSLNISVENLGDAIVSSNVSLGNLTIKDGYYQWNVRFDSQISSKEDVEKIVLKINDRVYKFSDLAKVSIEEATPKGMVRSGDKRSVTFAVIKQNDAQMSDLKNQLNKLINNFNNEYKDINFTVSRNQTELLDYSINNLKSNIIVGAILAVLVIFFFLKDFKSPMLVVITIPLSLVISLLALYLLGISINIISLSGLILGIGMMVDNSIIVIDNITQYWERFRYKDLDKAIVKGTVEVITPMLSSVLTTCSVFIPLIFLSGIAGSLFYDQAMGVTVALFSSFFISIIVIPVYYRIFYKKSNKRIENKFLKKIQVISYERTYERCLKWFFRHQMLSWSIFIAFIPLTILLYVVIDKSQLPPLTQTDTVLEVDWNTNVNIKENDRRVCNLLSQASEFIVQSNSMIGEQDFLLGHSGELGSGAAIIYFKLNNSEDIIKLHNKLSDYLKNNFPEASFEFKESANIFNLIFSKNQAPVIAQLKSNTEKALMPDEINSIISDIKSVLPDIYIEPVLWQEQILFIADQELMALYNVSFEKIHNVLSNATKDNTVFSIRSGSSVIPIIVADENLYNNNLLSLKVKNIDGISVPLQVLLKERKVKDLKKIISGKNGDFYPLNIYIPDNKVKEVVSTINKLAKNNSSFDVSFAGAYFSSRDMIKELVVVLIISLLLLFFILSAQFESVLQPFIILSEVIVDLFGALFLLFICGAGINLMSLIGIVVMCGIIINDSILKVDTINRLRNEGYPLLKAIMTAGSRRLKPILMTSLTTILAIAPFLIRGDIGSDLQFPLSVALIGGMILGTLVSIFYIPLFYYEIYRRKK